MHVYSVRRSGNRIVCVYTKHYAYLHATGVSIPRQRKKPYLVQADWTFLSIRKDRETDDVDFCPRILRGRGKAKSAAITLFYPPFFREIACRVRTARFSAWPI